MATVKPSRGNKTVKYDVQSYLSMLRLAKRSEQTIKGYEKILNSYAQFLDVPLNEVHRYLDIPNLLKYADSRKGKSDAGTKTNLNIIRRFFAVNGVVFDEMEFNAVNPKVNKEHNDKPLELETLQKMMDLTDAHGRAVLSFLVSTGCRAGETCEILLSDVHGDVVTIRNEIAKGGHGGNVYLNAEAREYLDLWLKERDAHLLVNASRLTALKAGPKPKEGEPDTRRLVHVPENDQRLFAISYSSLRNMFDRLYQKVDGEQGKYHSKCTVHSCRKYFRTNAAQAMHPDLVTGLMRQTGYLDSTYVRMGEDEKRKQFHAGEAALYITRADHRIQTGKLSELEKQNAELTERLKALEASRKIMNEPSEGAAGILQTTLTPSELKNMIADLILESSTAPANK